MGSQRFDRPHLHRRLIGALESGAGVKMFGLRRTGKSTLREVAREHFGESPRPCAYIDAQGSRSLADFVLRLAQALPGERGLLRRALDAVSTEPARKALAAITEGESVEAATVSTYWQVISNAVRQASVADGPKPVLIVDEFPYLIDNLTKSGTDDGKRDADDLLASMREWRDQGMTMLLTGSIGLMGIARSRGLNVEHLNDLRRFEAPELTEEEARDFIARAVEAEVWTESHTEELLRECGVLYPCFLVCGLLEIGIDAPCPPEEIARIFAHTIRPELHDAFISQFNRRFKDYAALPEGERDVLILPALKTVFEADEPPSQDDMACADPFSKVDLALALEVLTEDGFLTSTETLDGDRRWAPASRLATLWWKRSKLA